MPTIDWDKYRPNVGIMLLNQDGLVWVGARRDYTTEYWQMPQGGVDTGEDLESAMWRELHEETGIQKSHCHLLGQTHDWIPYDLPPDLAKKLWHDTYKGQKQIWFAVRLVAPDSVINIETQEPEFRAWKWVSVDTLVNTIVPFKRDVYKQVVQELGHFAS